MKFRVIYFFLLVQDYFAKMSNSLGSVSLIHNSLQHILHLISIWRAWRWNVCKEISLFGFILRIYFHWWNLHVEKSFFFFSFFVTGINYIVGKKDFFGFCQVTIQSFGPSWMRIVSSIELFFFLYFRSFFIIFLHSYLHSAIFSPAGFFFIYFLRSFLLFFFFLL